MIEGNVGGGPYAIPADHGYAYPVGRLRSVKQPVRVRDHMQGPTHTGDPQATTTVILDRPFDWYEWLFIVKNRALD